MACVEVPAPAPGRPYSSGLEHAELVVGTRDDSVEGNAPLLRFMESCRRDTSLRLDFRDDGDALSKRLNPDVSVRFAGVGKGDGGEGGDSRVGGGGWIGPVVVKFHTRPLYEVIEWEIRRGEVIKLGVERTPEEVVRKHAEVVPDAATPEAMPPAEASTLRVGSRLLSLGAQDGGGDLCPLFSDVWLGTEVWPAAHALVALMESPEWQPRIMGSDVIEVR